MLMAATPASPEVEGGRRESEWREEGEGCGCGVVLGILAGRPLGRPVPQNPVNGGHARGSSLAANACTSTFYTCSIKFLFLATN